MSSSKPGPPSVLCTSMAESRMTPLISFSCMFIPLEDQGFSSPSSCASAPLRLCVDQSICDSECRCRPRCDSESGLPDHRSQSAPRLLEPCSEPLLGCFVRDSFASGQFFLGQFDLAQE